MLYPTKVLPQYSWSCHAAPLCPARLSFAFSGTPIQIEFASILDREVFGFGAVQSLVSGSISTGACGSSFGGRSGLAQVGSGAEGIQSPQPEREIK